MIILIHGDDNAKSRIQLKQLQQKKGIIQSKEVAIEDITPNDLKNLVIAKDLFAEQTFVVLDITDSSAKHKNFLDILAQLPNEVSLILYAQKDLPASNIFLKYADTNSIKVLTNKIEIHGDIFKFLDSVFNKNKANAYKELDKLLKEGKDYFYIFTMLNYALRNIIYAKYESEKWIKMNSFPKSKSKIQAEKHSHEEIKTLYSDLYKLDLKIKTGKTKIELAIPYFIQKVIK